MKRLIALLCLGMLVLFASDVGAQGSATFSHVTGRQLRWADYTNNIATAWRDTSTFSNADAPDTTEVLKVEELEWWAPGMDISGTAAALLRFMVTSYVTNGDSCYVGVDGAFSPGGPWYTGTDLGYLSGTAGDAAITGTLIVDTDNQSGVATVDLMEVFPFVRFRFRSDATGNPLSGARFYIYSPTSNNKSVPKMRTERLRWVALAGQYADANTSGLADQYVSVTYSDTTSLYWAADTTTNTVAIDTTESFDMSRMTMLGSGRGASGSPGLFAVGIEGAVTGGNADSVAYYLDVGPTPQGPWVESSGPLVAVRDYSSATYCANWRVVVSKNTGAVTPADPETLVPWAPYVRFRVKMLSKGTATNGLRGVSAYVRYPAAVN